MHFDPVTRVSDLSDGLQDTPLWQFFFSTCFIYLMPFFQESSGLTSCIIWWRYFFLTKVTEIGKINFSVIIAAIGKSKMHHQNHESHRYILETLVNWISNMATSKMYILRMIQILKNITISHCTTTFHSFALKIETGWVTKMVIPILKT